MLDPSLEYCVSMRAECNLELACFIEGHCNSTGKMLTVALTRQEITQDYDQITKDEEVEGHPAEGDEAS
jgi:hypothetical protein